jgi:hypothetical protein
MRKHKILLSVAVALLVFAGLAMAQATFTTVKGTETPVAPVKAGEVKCNGATPTGNPFMPCPPGVKGTVRDRLSIALEATTDDRLNGLNYITGNANIHADGTINIWGTFQLEVTSGGVWEGVWEGKQVLNGVTSYSATGHGSGGTVEGLQLLWTGIYQPNSLIAEISVRILAPPK